MEQKTFMEKLEAKLMPVASKIRANKYLTSIRDGFALAMPLLIVGSIFMLIANFPIKGWIDLLNNTTIRDNSISSYLGAATNATFSIMSIFVVFGIGYSFAKQIDSDAVYGGISALVGWFILMPFQVSATHEATGDVITTSGIPLDWVGSKGIFIGIFCAFLAVSIYNWVVNKGWVVKMPEGVPPTVGESFASLLPLGLVMVTFVLIRVLFSLTPYGNAFDFVYSVLQLPLENVGGTLPAMLLVYLFAHVLWFFGIHGTNITDSVYLPVLLSLSAENLAAVEAGLEPQNIINVQFQNLFATYGGAGSTLSLLIVAVIIAKSDRLKELAKLSIVPGIFGINEPVIYGLPIVLNPMLAIPFIGVPLVNITITYFTMKCGWVPITNGIVMPWTTPPIVSGYLSSGWQGAVLQLFLIILGCFIYYPFVKTVDNSYYIEQENNK